MSTVLAVVPDLFFAAKIEAVAKAAGAALAFASAAEAHARCVASAPDRVLVDLHAPGAMALVAALKADARTRGIPVTGFYSHVENVIRAEALAAGADDVLPRSAFVTRLPALLGGAPH